MDNSGLSVTQLLLASLLSGTVGAAIVQAVSWLLRRWQRRRSFAGLLLLEVHGIYLTLSRMAVADHGGQYLPLEEWPVGIYTSATPYLVDLFPPATSHALWFYYDRIEVVQKAKDHIVGLIERKKPLTESNKAVLLGYVRQALVAYEDVKRELFRFAPARGVTLMKTMQELGGDRGGLKEW